MRVVVQNCKDFTFYKGKGLWTKDSRDALSFPSSAAALNFLHDTDFDSVQIILMFSNARYDLKFPVSDDCREQQRRAALN